MAARAAPNHKRAVGRDGLAATGQAPLEEVRDGVDGGKGIVCLNTHHFRIIMAFTCIGDGRLGQVLAALVYDAINPLVAPRSA